MSTKDTPIPAIPEPADWHGWQVSVTNGHSGYGVYAHMTEYPEEGSIFLLAIDLGTPAQMEAEGTFACPVCGKDTPHHHPRMWTLTAPDGRQWHGDSPIKACREEQRSRIPDAVAVERVMQMAATHHPEGRK